MTYRPDHSPSNHRGERGSGGKEKWGGRGSGGKGKWGKGERGKGKGERGKGKGERWMAKIYFLKNLALD